MKLNTALLTTAIVASFSLSIVAIDVSAQENTYPAYAQSHQTIVNPQRTNIPLRKVPLDTRIASRTAMLELRNNNIASRTANIQLREDLILQNLKMTEMKVASREAALRIKLATFKNQQKASAAASINNSLNQVNQNITTIMANNLLKLTNILNEINQKLQQNPTSNTPTVQTAINQASTDVSIAQTSVTDQAAKMYLINVTTEANIRQDAMTARNSLYNDLKAMNALILKAKQSVTMIITQTQSTTAGSQ